ncbi:T9SS type A sorting domain-containing protein [Kordia sp.]|uniref:T9SS type A sorting domain-containing protein n=1 Tax=Kordia sp. TaxID=1965332 RepID=UPI003B5A7069
MKKKLLFTLIVLTVTLGFSQVQFQERIIVDDTFTANNVNSVLSVDIDGDGDMDVLSASFSDSKIAWYENTDGQGSFGTQKVITTNANGASSVYAADLDGDGDLDVLSTSSFDQTVAWYENLDGQGTFGAQQVIAIDTNAIDSLAITDIDGDGDLDVLFPNSFEGGIIWHENTDGEGDFSAQSVIATDASILGNIHAVDMDNDGDMDIVSSALYDNKIAWHENTNGQGLMATEIVISTAVNDPQSVFTSDMDNDGDMDVLTASRLDDKIAWYENTDGQGTFGKQQIVTTNADSAVVVYAEDVDSDGDMDIISASSNDNKVAWYENTDSEGTFGAEQIITTNAENIKSVFAIDIDGDNDIDIISSSSSNDSITWHENTNGQGTFNEEYIIISNPGWNKSVYAVDIDGDGDLDALSGSGGSFGNIAWFENTDGQGSFGAQKIITTNIDDAESVFAADLDGDGDMDVLSASYDDDKIAWYENTDGQGTFSDQQIISTGASNARSVYAVDIDGDNDMDVLSTYSSISEVVWFENTDSQGNFGSRQTVTYNADFSQSVYAEDIDGDGDMDILSASSSDDKIAWYENTDGLGDFGSQQIITTNADGASSVYAIDLDGDGDIDVLSASRGDDKIAWYENTDGQGTFGDQQVITTNADFAVSVFAADIDNDGDNDVISASSTDDKIAWYENTDGQGTFGVQQIIATNTDRASDVYAADIDNDGDIDILASSQNDNKVVWFENLGEGFNEVSGTISLDINNTGCSTNSEPMANVMITTTDGASTLSTFSNTNGVYQLFTDEGTFTTSIAGLPNYFTANPMSQASNFTGVGNTDTVNFCIQPNGAASDLNVSIYPSLDEPRPGFDTTYQIVYNNIGTTQLSGDITFEFDSSKVQFLNASETVAMQTANTLTFNFTNIHPFETRTIDLNFNVFPPPTTNIDEILTTTAIINPISADATPEDNVFTLNQTVIGSYDPNDIQVLEGDRILLEDADKYLHYIIRFQNTGTASAINVNVENVLDPNLDWTTIQLESLSHSGRVEITNGNMINFVFDNINLPDSNSDEPNSHGFITYKIKPKNTVALGDIIYNTADIFFDFNPAITTNTVATEIVDALSVNEFTDTNFSIYPNPTSTDLFISGKENINTISISDLTGKLLKMIKIPNTQTSATLKMSNYPIGLYFLSIETQKGIYTHKVIRK